MTEPHVDDRTFRDLIEQIPDHAIFLLDADGHNVTWNEGVRRVFGYEEHEWVGQPSGHVFTEEDRAAREPARELAEAARSGRANDDRWLVRRDGSRFFAAGITSALLDDDGSLLGFGKVVRDQTQWKLAQDALEASEERLRIALQAARMGIWRWHMPSNRQEIDESLSRLLGLGAADSVTSLEQFLGYVHSDDRERVHAAFAHSRATGAELNVEFRVVWPDGSVRWLADYGRVANDPHGRPAYLTGACVDISERKHAEARLIEAQRMDAVGQLAGGVAHEINNMMTAVLGFSDLLVGEMAPGDRRRADVEQIRRAAGRAATITGQLLAFSRRQLMRPSRIDLNEVLRPLEPVLRHILGEDKLLSTSYGADLGAIVADAGQIEQVILNLTLNARDAMASGGRLTLRTRAEIGRMRHGRGVPATGEDARPTGRDIVLEVSDTGHGMDAATRVRAFEPFFTTKPVGQGTGLGLSTVFGIVQQTGGSIDVDSEPGRGTTFELRFAEVETESNAAALGHAAEPSARPATVLVVEDEELIRGFACRYLSAAGYRPLGAANGTEALEIVRSEGASVALVITDVIMPEMGGRELAERIATLRPGLPVLFMTGYGEDEAVRRGMIHPGAPLVKKPFTPRELADRVKTMLDRE